MSFNKKYLNELAKLMPDITKSIPHANFLTHLRYYGKKKKNKGAITGDFAFYLNAGNDIVRFYLAKKTWNLIFLNLVEAIEQMEKTGNYTPKKESVDAIVDSVAQTNTLYINDVNNLRLVHYKNNDEFSYFPIDPNQPKRLEEPKNKYRFLVVKAVYGWGEHLEQAMEMFQKDLIGEPRIELLNPNYVLKHTKEGQAIARICRLEGLDNYYSFRANSRDINNLVLELGKYKRKIEKQPILESAFPQIFEHLLSPDSRYSEVRKRKLVKDLQLTLKLYYQRRLQEAAVTMAQQDLIEMSQIPTEAPSELEAPAAEVFKLLLSPHSRYNRFKRDKLALLLQSILNQVNLISDDQQ